MAIDKKALEEQKQLLQDLVELNKEEAKLLKQVEAAERKLTIARRTESAATAQLEQNLVNLRKQLNPLAQEMLAQRDAIKEAEKQLELYQKRIDALADVAEGATGVMDKLFDTSFSSAIDRTQTLGLSFSGLVGGLVDYAKELDQTSVQLARTTGFGNALTGAFNKAHMEIGAFAGSMAELGEAMGALSTEFMRFNALSENQQASLAAQGVQFQKLGVSAAQFAQTQEALSFAFGITDQALQEATTSMDKFAMSTGQPITRVLEDLTSLAPELARFGSMGARVFRNLSRQARQLGLTTQAAFDITELFDTFEGAANAAGRLNAQLGLQVNSVELMTANSDERLELLRQEFAIQGKSFELMGKREKQMVADILGTDVMTAGKAFGQQIPLSQLARETERKPEEFATMAEVGKAIEEGKFKAQNLLIRQQTNRLKDNGMKLADMTGLLGSIQMILTGIAAAMAIRSAVGLAKNLRGPKAPGSMTPKTPKKKFYKVGKGKFTEKQIAAGFAGKEAREKLAAGGIGQFTRRGRAVSALKNVASKGGTILSGAKTKVASKTGGIFKKGAGILGKIGLKGLAKIPLLGIVPGLIDAGMRAASGDLAGAGLAALSTAAAQMPGFGTAASLAIDAGSVARDMGAFDSKASAPSIPKGLDTMAKTARAVQSAQSKPIVVNPGKTEITLVMDKKPIKKVFVETFNEVENPVTPVSQ